MHETISPLLDVLVDRLSCSMFIMIKLQRQWFQITGSTQARTPCSSLSLCGNRRNTYEHVNDRANGRRLSSRRIKLFAASDLSWLPRRCVKNGVSLDHVSNNFCIFLLDFRASPLLEAIHVRHSTLVRSIIQFTSSQIECDSSIRSVEL